MLEVAYESVWFEIDRFEILPPGDFVIVLRRSHVGDLPVVSVVELLGEDSSQPCASSGRRVIEHDTDRAVVPIDRLLPDCRWDQLPDGAYRLMVTASLPAGSATDKSISARSVNAVIVVSGLIVGATPIQSPPPLAQAQIRDSTSAISKWLNTKASKGAPPVLLGSQVLLTDAHPHCANPNVSQSCLQREIGGQQHVAADEAEFPPSSSQARFFHTGDHL